MSSNNKTDFLQLNQWDSADKPKREDFNADNAIIDESFFQHCVDSVSHTNSAERNRWNTPYYFSSYIGNGEAKREIETKCPFNPTFGIIFQTGGATHETRFDAKLVQHFSAFVTQRGGTIGASLSGTRLTVTNYATPAYESEYATMNAVTCTYLYILFR